MARRAQLAKHEMLPMAERQFVMEAIENKFLADEEIRFVTDEFWNQLVSLSNLEEQEHILEATTDFIDRHAVMLAKHPRCFEYLKERQAQQTIRLQELRNELMMRMNGEDDGSSESISKASLGSRSSKGSNTSRLAGSTTSAGTGTGSGDVPTFRSLPTPRMGGGLT